MADYALKPISEEYRPWRISREGMMSSEPVERQCGECKGSGVAEYIDHMARPCDACGGNGMLEFTSTEAVLLDAIDQLEREVARKDEALRLLLALCEIAAVMPETIGKVWVPTMDLPELEQARTALHKKDDE